MPDGAQRGPARGPEVQRELLEDCRDGPPETVDPSHDIGRGQGHFILGRRFINALRRAALGLVKNPLCQELLIFVALHDGPLRPCDGLRSRDFYQDQDEVYLTQYFGPCLHRNLESMPVAQNSLSSLLKKPSICMMNYG